MSDTWSSIQAHKKQLDSLRERLQRRRKQDSGHLGEVWGGRGGPGRGERLLERKTAPGSAPFPEQPFIGLLGCWLVHFSPEELNRVSTCGKACSASSSRAPVFQA